MISKYHNLLMSPETKDFLLHTPEDRLAKVCNGVGSREGWFNRLVYHIIPNTIWGLDITPASDLHDIGYTVPATFRTLEEARKHKEMEDYFFETNCKILILRGTKWEWLRKIRNRRVDKYVAILKSSGMTSFMSNKTIGGQTYYG